MINKQRTDVAEAVADIFDGATIMIGGFGEAGSPIELIHALIDQGAAGLTVVNNNTGSGEVGLAAIQAKPGCQLTEQQVIDYLNGRLARFKIPQHIVFVDALPMSAQGKIQKAEIKRLYAPGA